MTNEISENKVAKLMRTLTHGVYVIGVSASGTRNAFTASWVMQVSFHPLLIAVAVNPHSASYRFMAHGAVFTINVLESGQLLLAEHFGAPVPQKLLGIPWTSGPGGAPILKDGLAFLACKVTSTMPAGDHSLVMGEVFAGDVLRPDGSPMRYQETGNMDGSSRFYSQQF